MNVFLDTNIALDFLLKRKEFFEDAKRVIAVCLNRKYNLYLSSISFSNISYIARKGHDGMSVSDMLSVLREMVSVSPVDQTVVDRALDMNLDDFEDAMQFFSALSVHSDYIITRNVGDFPQASIPIVSPIDFIKELKKGK